MNEQILCPKKYCFGRFRVTLLAHKYSELTYVDEIDILIDLTWPTRLFGPVNNMFKWFLHLDLLETTQVLKSLHIFVDLQKRSPCKKGWWKVSPRWLIATVFPPRVFTVDVSCLESDQSSSTGRHLGTISAAQKGVFNSDYCKGPTIDNL